MINSQDIKNGVCIRMDGRLYFVIEFLHVKPGKGNTIMRVKFKDVVGIYNFIITSLQQCQLHFLCTKFYLY